MMAKPSSKLAGGLDGQHLEHDGRTPDTERGKFIIERRTIKMTTPGECEGKVTPTTRR